MNWGLVKKGLQEGVVMFIACGLGLFAFAMFRVWIVSELDSARFKQIIDLLPKEWERFSTVDFAWLISYLGRTSATLSEPPILILISLWAIVRGSDVVSGEINRGTMEMVLAQPVSRRAVYASHTLVTAIGLVMLSLMVWAGMVLAVQFTEIKETSYPAVSVPLTGMKFPITFAKPIETTVAMREVVDARYFLPGLFNLFCLGFLLAGITAMLSACDRYRWRTLGIAAGIYLGSAVLKIGAMATPMLKWLGCLTFFTLYEPELHIKQFEQIPGSIWHFLDSIPPTSNLFGFGFGPGGANIVLLSLGALCWLIGARIFNRRDLPPPV